MEGRRSLLRGESHLLDTSADGGGGQCCCALSLDRVLDKALEDDPLFGEREALRLRDGARISFAQLNSKAAELAARLARAVQVSPPSGDKIVAVNLLPDAELIVTLLAIFKIGAAYLPLDPTFPADRVAHILQDAQPMLLVTTGSVLRACGFEFVVVEHNVPVFDLEENGEPIPTVEEVEEERRDSLAAVLYTSGSTGIPKGVRLDHGTILHRLRWQWRTFPYSATEVGCFKTALTFVDSIAEIWAPLLIGQPLEIVAKPVTQDTQRFIDLLDRCKITRLVLVPSLLRAMLSLLKAERAGRAEEADEESSSHRPLEHLKMWVCSGEVLTGELLLEFYDCFPAGTVICNYYGSTEVMGDVTYAAFRSRDDVLATLIDDKTPIGIIYIYSCYYSATLISRKSSDPVLRVVQ